MHTLLYNEINPSHIPELNKVIRFIENGDFQSADIKKLDERLYCARLNRADRLLFTLYKTEKETYALILEHIKNHAYEKSRFLKRGVKINEALIPSIDTINQDGLDTLAYFESKSPCFHLLSKPITFDDAQRRIYDLSTPIIIIGTAGSGKTLLLLEKMKRLCGDVLYLTQSSYLIKHSQDLYYTNQYTNAQQAVSFLSFQEFLDSIAVPEGKVMDFMHFRAWFAKHLNTTHIQSAQALFEEFRGVITGSTTESAYLSRQEYLSLGIKESVFSGVQRLGVYKLFESYIKYLKVHDYYDHNLVSFDYLSLSKKQYDYIVVDEVQDISTIQLSLILSCLKHSSHFLLCGDANQIVYPNFFSWTKTKSLFFEKGANSPAAITQILNTNYRNSAAVIDVANKLLRIKNWRFGSIDKESHYEMKSSAHDAGELVFLKSNQQTLSDINDKTYRSKKFAVIVLYDDLKAEAAKYFQTPLIFSVLESKGLEYENVILFNLVSSASQRYEEIAEGVGSDALDRVMTYSRNKDKSDRSLEKYKFFVNALFVAITRAERNLYWVEAQAEHPLLKLLRAEHMQSSDSNIKAHTSSEEEWQQEATKLAKQGKSIQAEKIREDILQQQSPRWEVIAGQGIDELYRAALEKGDKKAKLLLFEYALVYEDHHARNELISIGFKPALHPEGGFERLLKKHFMMYQQEQLDTITQQITRYGVDFRNPFNQTPLMVAAWLGSSTMIDVINCSNPDVFLANNKGHNAFQIALERACLHPNYAAKNMLEIYPLLVPETLSLRINNKLITLVENQPEFFLINLMLALFYRILPESMVSVGGAFNAMNLTQAIAHLPSNLFPDDYQQPEYIAEVLSNNPQLFIQMSPDNYLLNPKITLMAEGDWLPIYDILWFDDLAIGYQQSPEGLDANSLYGYLLAEKVEEFKQVLGRFVYPE